MSDVFTLIYTISLNKYILKLYTLNNNNNYIDQSTIDSLMNELNNLELASEIVEIVQILPGIVKTQIYDLYNNLLIDSGIIIE
jgi:hypothetical protein